MKTTRYVALASLVALFAGGCVSKGKYEQALAETKTTQSQLAAEKNAHARSSSELSNRESEIATLKAAIDDRHAEISRLEKLLQTTKAESTSDRALNATRIADLQKRIGELQRAQAATEARVALYRELTRRLQTQLDAGDLEIAIRDGRMVLQLPNDVLFDSGRTDLKPAGEAALEAIADVLASLPDRQFQVAGHTDNVPIHKERFPSNWELSSARALRVLHFLVTKGVDPGSLSAAGYGEHDPLGPNDSADARKRNRRTEITLQPNVSEIVRLP